MGAEAQNRQRLEPSDGPGGEDLDPGTGGRRRRVDVMARFSAVPDGADAFR
jgi:hypothetical protein